MHELETTNNFDKQFEKLLAKNPRLKTKIYKTLNLLRNDLHNPVLRLHKLTGKDNWSVWVTGDIRIILRWRSNTLFCVQIGSHDEVY